jgi:hypothetical protein
MTVNGERLRRRGELCAVTQVAGEEGSDEGEEDDEDEEIDDSLEREST